MQRQEALELVKLNVNNKNLINHMLACEAVMKGLARHFSEDEEKWGLAGLLHDIDYNLTMTDPFEHGLLGAKMLKEKDVDSEIIHAIEAHNEMTGVERKNQLDKALYCTDPLTGLIVAGALIKKEKGLNAIDLDFLKRRFDEKGFAKGASRIQIAACREINLSLDEFITIGLKSMQEIHQDLGL
ncbi:hypothetical protein SAMN00017405_1624 [Desulfonispora thiosulfatigenes DSM 11270]|uniref:HD domain-containing protein n=1 Tax=Desulfonispora thiosulfatigenes DSM 11270 TaxID=656914 RepID=A0A1W1UVY1_DESTI|nr:HDIG domain-containing metalloprotein [Desulfonispora thiosulfatigenes]SMB85257.1 hypothetical protein SAMN00017405_1624 [Desulfonispora thiosulfatigenes DSM 11270]